MEIQFLPKKGNPGMLRSFGKKLAILWVTTKRLKLRDNEFVFDGIN